MDFPRFSFPTRAISSRRGIAYSLVLGGALLITPLSASAQKASPSAPTTATGLAPMPSAPVPAAPGIGILLLAIDELPAPGAALPLPPAPRTITPAPQAPGAITPADPNAPPAAITPAAITPAAITPAAITPAAITPAALIPGARPFWLAPAQKKKKVDKDADLFKLEPEFTRPTLPRPATPDPVLALPVAPAPPLQPAQPLGRAHATAIPLRRALLAFGWGDVSLATPDAALVKDALAERRLTPRALEALKIALAEVVAPGTAPSPEVTARATQAAARVGQALGYRAVAAIYVAPSTSQNGMENGVPNGAQNAAFSIFLADSARESGEPILFDERGANADALRDAGASTAAALLDKTLRSWPLISSQERLDLATKHLATAKTLIAKSDVAGAQDELNQSISLDTSRGEAYVLLGDLLAPNDPTGAAGAYRRAVELDARDGATLAKIAVTYASGSFPDWPRALDAGRKAILAGYDSVPLRVALATAQYGRADLFRRADRLSKAEDAETDAKIHLDRALELAPDNSGAVRLLARRLVETRRFAEATQTLDRVAPLYPGDLEIQTQYALALANQIGREEDAFVAASRVWKLSGLGRVDVDPLQYRALAKGFDTRIYNIGKSAVQLTTGVSNAALPREDALIQLTKLKEDMDAAEVAIGVLRAPTSAGLEGVARQFAATLMTQALEQEQLYLETGQSLARLRGFQLYTQAVAQLNSARGGR